MAPPLQDDFLDILHMPPPPNIIHHPSRTLWHVPNHLEFSMVDSLLAREGSKKSMVKELDSCHKFDTFGPLTYFTENTSENDIIINGFLETPFVADYKRADADSRPM